MAPDNQFTEADLARLFISSRPDLLEGETVVNEDDLNNFIHFCGHEVGEEIGLVWGHDGLLSEEDQERLIAACRERFIAGRPRD